MTTTTHLPSGEVVPVLGQGTWTMGADARQRKEEIASLRLGIELGMTLIDTAEMYADGGAERVVAQAIAGQRNAVFLVSKVLPEHATRRGAIAACERSLRRLKTDYLDLYLLHWREKIPLSETLEAFSKLLGSGKIRHWGVSNFDVADMRELMGTPYGANVAANEVMYNVRRRGIEYTLMPGVAGAVYRSLPIRRWIRDASPAPASSIKSASATMRRPLKLPSLGSFGRRV